MTQRDIDTSPYTGPAGGWGSVRSLADILPRERVSPLVLRELSRQNKPDGFQCVSCAWSKPGKPHPFEFCENGAKATAWELTSRRATPDFFARHTVSELLTWSDYDLEQEGRLTHPLRYDRASDRYVPVAWDEAIAEIGRELTAIRERNPNEAVFYASGRASLETSYMYALFARLFGTNNLPDSSNMCHETTSKALKQSVGAPVGTVTLDDFETCDLILFFGQNAGSNSPRMLHQLQEARERGIEIITFNPLKERGLERFTNPQSPVEMLTGKETKISTQYHQVRPGGDIAAIMGLCKVLVALDDAGKPAIDHAFLAEHTHGSAQFLDAVRAASWDEIEAQSGLKRADIEAAGRVYARSNAVMAVYGMGLTQHVEGMHNVFMVVNLLLLRGNVGKPGAGLCPVRGHSNVQGQRTVGIADDPALVPVEVLEKQFGFTVPKDKGFTTVEACEAIVAGKVSAFVGLGGNFLRAIPDREVMERAWRRQRLTVQVATKLNRGQLVTGEIAYLLPCLGRIEEDVQATGPQTVSMEDSTSCIHASFGKFKPASEHLRAEAWIVAALAKSSLPANAVPWDAWVGDYARVRDAIAETYPAEFRDFNARFCQPGGFHRPNAARERNWKTTSGKAEFNVPPTLNATGFAEAEDVFRLITLRSNDQFNTTVYGYDDRFRGIKGTRDVVLMNPADMTALRLKDGDTVGLATASQDNVQRRHEGLRVVTYDIPKGAIGGYYPELNDLIPLDHFAKVSKVPAAKSVPVRVVASRA